MSNGGRFANNQSNHNNDPKNGKKKASGFAKFLITMGVILVLVAAGILGVTVYNMTSIQMEANKPTVPPLNTEPMATVEVTQPAETVAASEETVPETTLPYTPSGKDIINVMVVGQSYREDERSYLSDSNILVTINKKTKTVTLTSFLRDTYVDLADFDFTKEDGTRIKKPCGYNKINTAYALGYSWGSTAGAMHMMNETIKLNFGVDVDYNVEVDFDGFINAINVLGEIPIELTEAEANYINKTLNKALGYDAYKYQAVYEDGNTYSGMGGWECLTYARMRHSDAADNDFKRSERQRKLIGAILGQVRDSDLDTLMEFAKEIMSQITTNMTDDEILTCMWEVLPMVANLKLESKVVPMDGSYSSKSIMIGDVETFGMDITWNTKNRDMIMAYAEADQMEVTPVG